MIIALFFFSQSNAMREEISDYIEANDVLKAQLKEKTKQLSEMEQHYSDQVQVAAQELDGIQQEMENRQSVMEATNEQLILKVSHRHTDFFC